MRTRSIMNSLFTYLFLKCRTLRKSLCKLSRFWYVWWECWVLHQNCNPSLLLQNVNLLTGPLLSVWFRTGVLLLSSGRRCSHNWLFLGLFFLQSPFLSPYKASRAQDKLQTALTVTSVKQLCHFSHNGGWESGFLLN